jgi:hypothetical protein
MTHLELIYSSSIYCMYEASSETRLVLFHVRPKGQPQLKAG